MDLTIGFGTRYLRNRFQGHGKINAIWTPLQSHRYIAVILSQFKLTLVIEEQLFGFRDLPFSAVSEGGRRDPKAFMFEGEIKFTTRLKQERRSWFSPLALRIVIPVSAQGGFCHA